MLNRTISQIPKAKKTPKSKSAESIQTIEFTTIIKAEMKKARILCTGRVGEIMATEDEGGTMTTGAGTTGGNTLEIHEISTEGGFIINSFYVYYIGVFLVCSFWL